MSGPEILGVLGGLGGIIGLVIALVQAMRSSGNTPEATWQAAIKDLKDGRTKDRAELQAMKGQLTETLKRQDLYKADVDQLYGGVLILTAQLKRLGYEPEWAPPPKRPGTGPLGK